MKKTWQQLGVLVYWMTLPGIWLVLKNTKRTRLLIVDENRVVVVKPWLGNGKWCLPGGGLHQGETALDGVLRETKEEVGLVLDPKVCKQVGTQQYNQNGLSFSYQLFMTSQTKKQPLRKQKSEILAAEWVMMHELNKNNANYDVLSALTSTQKRT